MFVRPIANRDRTGESGAIASVALRSPRRGRVARRSPSIAIVGRRLLGRFLLGEGTRLIDRRQRMLSALVASVRGCIRDAWL